MLNVFRNNLKRFAPVLWIVIAVFVLLVFTDYGGNQQGNTSADTAATVGDYEISFGEVQNSYSMLEQRYRSIYGEAFDQIKDQINLPIQAVNSVVEGRIQLDDAMSLGLKTTNAELQKFILELPAFQNETGVFETETYERALQRNGLSVDDFETSQRENLLATKFRNILSDTVWISDSELERTAREEAERAKIRYVSLDGANLADQVQVSDAELASYFAENQSNYEFPERRRAAYLSVNVNSVRANLEIPDADVQSYYDANPGEFSQEEQVRARHILLFVGADRTAEQAQAELNAIKARVQAGEDFGTIAQQVSEDEASKPSGGDLSFFGRGRMTPQFETAAFSGEQGDLIGPIENQLGPRTGFHLIEVIAKRDGGTQPYEEVANRIRVRLLNERAQAEAEAKARALSTQLAGSVPQGEDALREVAETEGIALEILDSFDQSANLAGIGRGTELAQKLFEAEAGGLTEAVRIPTGWALAQVLSVEEPRVPELAEVRDDVRTAVVAERQNSLAQERLAELQPAVASGELTLDAAAERLGVEVQESTEFGATDQVAGLFGVDGLNEAALALEAGGVGAPLTSATGAILFEVSERKHFDSTEFELAKDTSRVQLRSEQVGSLIGSWMQSKLSDLEVQYSKQMVDQFDLQAQLGADS